VVYSSDVKRSLLGVSEGPVVSESAATEMAEGARRVLGCDIALSLTGVAGPTEQDGQPVGTVWIGLAGDAVGGTGATLLRLGRYGGGDREQIRQIANISALDLLRHRLLEV
jgi:PncC family amidohydrolase